MIAIMNSMHECHDISLGCARLESLFIRTEWLEPNILAKLEKNKITKVNAHVPLTRIHVLHVHIEQENGNICTALFLHLQIQHDLVEHLRCICSPKVCLCEGQCNDFVGGEFHCTGCL